MSTATKTRSGATDRYLELVMRFPLRPIRTKAEYKRAMEFVDEFATAPEGSLPTDDADYFDILTMLIEDYDARHAPRG